MNSRAAWLFLFVALAVALKITSFGDLNRHADETFYFLVGQRMHQGLLPYVDVWDRKPLGLFLIYYLIAGISYSVVAYQIVASLFAAATAFVLALITARWSNARGAIMAGVIYLFIVDPFEGNTGQAPDFFNFFIALAALLIAAQWEEIAQGRTGWKVWSAMGLCGLAITIKQTALFESVFFGLFLLWSLHRAGLETPRLLRFALGAMALGAAPMLMIAAYYWQAGHWYEFWHAMVLSNLDKAEHGGAAWRLTGIVVRLLAILPLAIWGLASRRTDPLHRAFVLGWLVAAALGMASLRNFYGHYTLPLLPPMAIAAGLLLAHQVLWRPLLALVVIYSLMWSKLDQSGWRRDSNRTMHQIADAIVELDGGGGFLNYDAPPYLYAMTGKRFLSPLVFPHHLNHEIERNVSHLNTDAEIDRILANSPGVIAMARFPRNFPVNWYSRRKVLEYARKSCGVMRQIDLLEDANRVPIVIFGKCRPGGKAASAGTGK